MKNITRIFQLKIPFVILCGFVFLDIHHMITNSRFILIQLEPGENKDDGMYDELCSFNLCPIISRRTTSPAL